MNINGKIIDKINKLKKEKNAIILAHNYQVPEVQDIADFTGDSLELSKIAAENNASVIVFCGVKFMAETAKILSPDKKVLIPQIKAGCQMAEMADRESVLREKEKINEDVTVVCYVNTTAETKTACDICCTSANAVDIVKSVPTENVLFVPDKNLGKYVSKQVKEKKVFLYNGYCYVHDNISKEDAIKAKREHPDAILLVHPESPYDVIEEADFVVSTGGMVKKVRENKEGEFIIATEYGMIYRLQQECPKCKFYPVREEPLPVCYNMKKIKLQDILKSLEEDIYEIKLSPEIIKEAYLPIKRMVYGW